MQKSNPKLDRFISEITSGEAATMPTSDEAMEAAIWSGDITELDPKAYEFYALGNAGAPRYVADGWFIFSDEKTVATPGILFWERGDRRLARHMDQEQWDKFIKAAKVAKKLW